MKYMVMKVERSTRLPLIFLLLLIGSASFSQPNKRTNFWFFSTHVGLDFNSGAPVENPYCPIPNTGWGGTSVMSNNNGNLLFYSNGHKVWNREHQLMANGDGGTGFFPGFQGALCMPMPGSDSLFYIFTARHFTSDNPMFYYVVDLTKNEGLGEVIDKDTLAVGWDAAEQLTASYLKNKEDFWLITRKFRDNKFAAFKVTSQGVNPVPVLSDAPNRYSNNGSHNTGYMKISYDKKYLVNCFRSQSSYDSDVEICKFNNETGAIDFLYSFKLKDIMPGVPPAKSTNLEFSPCSKYMYLAGELGLDTLTHIYQFDMQYIEDQLLFRQTALKIGEPQGSNLQLAPDGKIYCFTQCSWNPTPDNNYVGIIHNPEKPGDECNYEGDAFLLNNGVANLSFVNFAPDFLYRFDFDGICEGDVFTFDPWFFPQPVSIQWNFGDPASGANNTSTIPHATHVFTDGGSFEVSVHVVYTNGRIEETSRRVEVEYAPEPDLGPDTILCSGQVMLLDADCGPHSYTWSTGQIGVRQITVSDTGWYWVKVINGAWCFAYDSIYIANYTAAIADTTNLIIGPTTCGGSTGAIRGLTITGTSPYTFQWLNDIGNPVASTLNLYQLPVGNYSLQVTDGNNCTSQLGPYSIIDAGDVLVNGVSALPEYCGRSDGTIHVIATSGLGDMLYYSINNGNNYFLNNGVFTGLSSGTYAVRVHDSTFCEDAYANNPILIENIRGPEITDIQITPATIGQNDGSFIITALSAGDTLYYSKDNGASFQINDGLFANLVAGYYTCLVVDGYGCDTSFIVELTENFTYRLNAVAGDDHVCPGYSAYVPLTVSNFNDVAGFKATLFYNKDYLTCTGYANAHPLLADSLSAMLFPAEAKVELEWVSASLSLPDNSIIAELVFQTTTSGGSQIEWDGSAGASMFLNSTGLSIPVDYTIGEVKIYKEVYFTLAPLAGVCQGETMMLQPMMWSSNGSVTYLWINPNGDSIRAESIVINNAQTNQEGIYSLTVTDAAACKADAAVEVIIYPNPVPEFSLQDTIFTVDPIVLDAGAGFLHYLWNTGDTTQSILIEENGWYAALVESMVGCLGKDSSYVMFSSTPEPMKFYFPNAFTPNGDGVNDVFMVVTDNPDMELFSMEIYDRWGAMIFQSHKLSNGWDGTYKGRHCPAGTYVFKIASNYSTLSPSTIETKMGTVMLVR